MKKFIGNTVNIQGDRVGGWFRDRYPLELTSILNGGIRFWSLKTKRRYRIRLFLYFTDFKPQRI